MNLLPATFFNHPLSDIPIVTDQYLKVLANEITIVSAAQGFSDESFKFARRIITQEMKNRTKWSGCYYRRFPFSACI